jgi:Peptidase family S41
MKYLPLLYTFIFLVNGKTFAQTCSCETEFLNIKNIMEQHYAGYKDKIKFITKAVYDKKTSSLIQMAKSSRSKEKCVLIISTYISLFKDQHVSFSFSTAANNTGIDSVVMNNKEVMVLPEKKLQQLRLSKGIEGIYYFRSDSSYKVAVIRDPAVTREYVAVLLESKIPHWKKGMVKFEMQKYRDKMMKGVLYLRNHSVRPEWFSIGENSIGGDWQREGTTRKTNQEKAYVPVASKSLTPKTLYIKISSFDVDNAKNIDSLIKANRSILDSTPNLILDLRNNGGGADFAYGPLLPYIYTNPVKGIGVDVLSTEFNIATWKKILTMEGLPEETIKNLNGMIKKMESNKGKFVNIADDEIDSSFTPVPYPKNIIVLINQGCASTTEQFLLAALQSKKVRLMGEPTGGVLDYANVRETDFSCLPYTLYYATTRSRRVDAGQGIDNIGIKPHIIAKSNDWIEEALKILEP